MSNNVIKNNSNGKAGVKKTSAKPVVKSVVKENVVVTTPVVEPIVQNVVIPEVKVEEVIIPKKEVKIIEPISMRINKRLISPVQVKNTTPNDCFLILDKTSGKQNERKFNGYQTQTLLVQEVINIANTTKLFKGEDGYGKNAILYIDDEEVREYLGFDIVNEDGDIVEKQDILDDENILSILEDSDEELFESEIESFKGNIVKTNLLKDVIRRNKYNNAQRVKYIERILEIEIRY